MTLTHARADVTSPDITRLKTKIFVDGADVAGILEHATNPLVKGFTTNPTLMRDAGITDYETFARNLLENLPRLPVSFEVFADEAVEMERQARKIARWGENVYVKIPVTNTRGESTAQLVSTLSRDGVQLNVTALLTVVQVAALSEALVGGAPAFVSVFAGRIADTGRDPSPIMQAAVEVMAPHEQLQLIWASPREVLNLLHADAVGCHIITMTPQLLKKLPLIGRDLEAYSLDTVRMFHDDARSAGYSL